MLRVNAINRQGLLKCLTFNPKSLVFKTVSVLLTNSYLAVDNTEVGYRNRIPLWMFGLLY